MSATGTLMTIDGPAGAGKTTAGVWLAHRLALRYVETGYLFRALAADHQRPVDAVLHSVDIDVRVPPRPDWRPTLRVGAVAHGEARQSEIESRLATLTRDPTVRSAVAGAVVRIVGRGGCVVVGRRSAFDVGHRAQARVLLDATLEVRLRRRLRAADDVGDAAAFAERMREREPESVEDRSIYSLVVDTTDKSIDEVRDILTTHMSARSIHA